MGKNRLPNVLYFALVSALLCCFASQVSAQSIGVQEKDFTNPDDSISYFINGIASNDIAKAFQACAIQQYARSYDFKGVANRLHTFMLPLMLMPSSSPMFAQMNSILLMNRIVSQVKFFCYSLLSNIEGDLTQSIFNPTDEQLNTFMKSVNPSRLSAIKIKKIASLPQLKKAEYMSTLNSQAKTFGADETTQRIVLLEFETVSYIEGFDLLRYGKAWRIDSLASNFAGTSPTGAAKKTTVDDFNALAE